MNILVVKTSSLGDIVQSFHVLEFLYQLFPNISIDWVAEKKFASIVAAHPLVHRTIPIERENIFKWASELRKNTYDVVFDLQGNSKSALITLFSKAKIKVGFGFRSVREWPNILATHSRFNVNHRLNIRLQYLSLIAQFFQVPLPHQVGSVLFQLNDVEKQTLNRLMVARTGCQIMVCPGSQWMNKQLSLEVLIPFLALVQKKCNASFLLMWGNQEERQICEKMKEVFEEQSDIIERLSLPVWQNLMAKMDLVIAVDSSALHLCGTTATRSFSVFGPTSPDIFKPVGERHFAFQGSCPYGKKFEKRCPILRTCTTGGCIKGLSPEDLFQAFSVWWDRVLI